METLPVQSAEDVAVTPSVSTGSRGPGAEKGPFALTLDRALANTNDSRSSINPEAPLASPEPVGFTNAPKVPSIPPDGKVTRASSSESASPAIALLPCSVAPAILVAPVVATSGGGAASTPGAANAMSDSPTELPTNFGASAHQASTDLQLMLGSATSTEVAGIDKSSPATGPSFELTGRPTAAVAVERDGRESGPAKTRSADAASGAEQNQLDGSNHSQLGSDTSPVVPSTRTEPVREQQSAVVDPYEPLSTLNPTPAAPPVSRQETSTPADDAVTPPLSEPYSPGSLQSPPRPLAGPGLRGTPYPAGAAGHKNEAGLIAASGFGNPSPLPKTTDHSGRPTCSRTRESGGRGVGDLTTPHDNSSAGQATTVEVTGNFAFPSGEIRSAASLRGSEDALSPSAASLPGYLSLSGMNAGTDTYRITPSEGQEIRAASGFGAEASDHSVPGFPTDHLGVAESSGAPPVIAEPHLPPASYSAQESGGNEIPEAQSGPQPAIDAPDRLDTSSSWPIPTTADLQVNPGPAPSSAQLGHAASSSRLLSMANQSRAIEVSTPLAEFAVAEVSVHVSGNTDSGAPEKAVGGFATTGADNLSRTLPGAAGDFVAARTIPKAENGLNTSSSMALHFAPASDKLMIEMPVQKSNQPEPAGTSTAHLASTGPSLMPQNGNSEPSLRSPVLHKDPEVKTGEGQPMSATNASLGESGAYNGGSSSKFGSPGKSALQDGISSPDRPATPSVPRSDGNGAANSPVTLVAAHVPPAATPNLAAPPAAASSPRAPATLAAWQNYDGGAGSIVRSARLSDSSGTAEMRVELRSGVLGPLEVHAVLNAGSVGAEIHVRGQEAHTLLAAGLPSLERAMGERNLRVENLAVYQDQLGTGTSGEERHNPHSGSYPSHPQALANDTLRPSASAGTVSAEDEELSNTATGLSVRA